MGEYCHGCGQRFHEGRLRLREILRDLAQHATLERALLLTFVQMCIDPGGMVCRYVQGQRRCYVSPLAYLFFGAALMLLVYPLYSGLMDEWVRSQAGVAAAGPHPRFSPAQTEAFRDLTLRMAQQAAAGGVAMALPFALLIRLLFRRSGINIAEALVFALFVFGHTFLVHSLLVPIAWLADAGPVTYMASMYIVMLWVSMHAGATFSGRPIASALKAGLALAGSYVVWTLAFSTVLLLYVLRIY